MTALDHFLRITRLQSTRGIRRAIAILAGCLLLAVILFGGYYYWDRFVHLGDRSPVELSTEHLVNAIKEDPQNPDTRVALAEEYLRKGLYENALEQVSQVLSAYPEHEGALLVAGLARVRLNQPDGAVDPLERFIALRKDAPMANTDMVLETAYYFLGESYVKLERYDDAITVLEAALVISPTDADALYQLGLAHQAIGEAETALEYYHKAVRLVPNFTAAYSGMIDSYTALDQPSYVAYARGLEAFSQQDYKTAQTHLEYATQALPDFGPAYLGLGLTYEKQGNLEAARSALQRALEINPDDFAARQALGRVQATLGTETQQG